MPPSTRQDLIDLGACELAAAIRRGDCTSLEATEAHLERMAQVEPSLNAMADILAEPARAAARAADDAARQGHWLGPLHGLPMTIKEQYRLRGTVACLGLARFAQRVDTEDGPLVRRLRERGAVFLGKTNVMQTLAGWESDNHVYGRTCNPWDPTRSPGGSSGGEAAIIAARGSPLGLGGDIGGSIRVPAHCCGIQGFRPTAGRFTVLDTPPDTWDSGMEAIVPQPGPMARHVDDLELLLGAMSSDAPAPDHWDAPPIRWQDSRAIDPTRLRVGVFSDNRYFRPSPAITRAVDAAEAVLARAGVTVVRIDPPPVEEAVDLFVRIMSASGGAGFAAGLGRERPVRGLRMTVLGSRAPRWIRPFASAALGLAGQRYLAPLIRAGGARSTARYWKLLEARRSLQCDVARRLAAEGLDALVCPPFGVVATPHGLTENLLPAASYAFLFNVLGMPAGVVAATRVRPGEETRGRPGGDLVERAAARTEAGSVGMPVGVQVAAPHWRDETAIALMRVLETGLRREPDYPARPPI